MSKKHIILPLLACIAIATGYGMYALQSAPIASSTPKTPIPAGTSTTNTATFNLTVGDPLPVDPTMHPLMLGVISGPQNIAGDDVTEQYQAIGVTSVRNNDYFDDRLDIEQIFSCHGNTYPSWEGCDPTSPSSYNWTASDAQYEAYLKGGFVPFLRLGGEWQNGVSRHDFKGPQNAQQEKNWTIAAQTTIDRYLHWPEKTNAFSYINIWTEFPGEQFWDRSNAEFVTFFLDAYQKIKDTYPNLRVGGPGFNAWTSAQIMQGKTSVAQTFLKAFYSKGIHLDWLGWHTFTSDPSIVEKQTIAWQNLLDGTGSFSNMPWAGSGFFSDTEVIVDAYGNGGSTENVTSFVGTAQGAADLTASWIALQKADIQGAFYYRGNEMSNGANKKKNASNSSDIGLGLIDAQGNLRKGAEAFRLWSIMTNQTSILLSSTLANNASITHLASTDTKGTYALLLVNRGTSEASLRPTIQEKLLSSFAKVETYLVDAQHDGLTPTPLTGDAIALPPASVMLLIASPTR
jgi:hypothetical protein